MRQIKSLKAIPRVDGAIPDHVPKGEPPHRKLARLNADLVKTTEQLQAIKKEWATKNIKAQQLRISVSTPEVTHFENAKRDLASRLLAIQTEIGALNKELHANKAQRNGNHHGDQEPEKVIQQKVAPLNSLLII
jgi:hypothetical protein